jgi:hypothetical protein
VSVSFCSGCTGGLTDAVWPVQQQKKWIKQVQVGKSTMFYHSLCRKISRIAHLAGWQVLAGTLKRGKHSITF